MFMLTHTHEQMKTKKKTKSYSRAKNIIRTDTTPKVPSLFPGQCSFGTLPSTSVRPSVRPPHFLALYNVMCTQWGKSAITHHPLSTEELSRHTCSHIWCWWWLQWYKRTPCTILSIPSYSLPFLVRAVQTQIHPSDIQGGPHIVQ